MKGNRKGCYEYITRIKKMLMKVGAHMLSGAEELLTKNAEKG